MRNSLLISLIITISATIVSGAAAGRTSEVPFIADHDIDAVAAPAIISPSYKQQAPLIQHELQAEYSLSTVNGVSLYDNPASVVSKLGKPLGIRGDEWRTDLVIYDYSGIQIAFTDGYIQYVIIELSQQLVIDGEPLEASRDTLIAALGQPDYIAEDGIVFQRDEALLKLFIDMVTNEVSHISYYHIASV